MITTTAPADWRDLQRQVFRILREAGFAARLDKTITTARGQVNIDVYAEDRPSQSSTDVHP